MVYIKKKEPLKDRKIGSVRILFKGADFSGNTKEKSHWWTECDCGHGELISETCLRSGSHRRCSKCITQNKKTGKSFARIQ